MLAVDRSSELVLDERQQKLPSGETNARSQYGWKMIDALTFCFRFCSIDIEYVSRVVVEARMVERRKRSVAS